MLTIQMIKIMDKWWLKEGLDLKIVTFACISTGDKRGDFFLIHFISLEDYNQG